MPVLDDDADEQTPATREPGLPWLVVHGARDWMFPVDMARAAVDALEAAGADVSYREIEDLAHTYPVEMSGDILEWLALTPRPAPG